MPRQLSDEARAKRTLEMLMTPPAAFATALEAMVADREDGGSQVGTFAVSRS